MIRIPAAREQGTRVELRNPDPSCNPYLALACMLAAGIDGIKRKKMPPASVEQNIFAMSNESLEDAGVKALPGSLKDAIEAMKADELVKETLGEHIFTNYVRAKEAEWQDYISAVTEWEIDKYLPTC